MGEDGTGVLAPDFSTDVWLQARGMMADVNTNAFSLWECSVPHLTPSRCASTPLSARGSRDDSFKPRGVWNKKEVETPRLTGVEEFTKIIETEAKETEPLLTPGQRIEMKYACALG